jgi:hypothetical protein
MRMLKFKKKNRGGELIRKSLERGQAKPEERVAEPLHDGFSEESPSALTQLRKFPFGSPAEAIETVVTGLFKKSLFLIEVNADGVNAAVISRKGSFLDISLLKSYANNEILDIYRNLIEQEAIAQELPEEVGMELILPAVISDMDVNLPAETVVVHDGMVSMHDIVVELARFGDEKDLQRGMLREVAVATGTEPAALQLSVIRKARKRRDPRAEFLVCSADREQFEGLRSYLDEGGYALQRVHGFPSLLYASLWRQGEGDVMLLYVVGNTAHLLKKGESGGFEYDGYDLTEDMEGVEFHLSGDIETVLCGEGSYYEYLKEVLPALNPGSRCWDFQKDLPRAIIRLERGVTLTNAHAMIVSAAYNELFNNRFAAGRLGITSRQSIYELLADNVSVLPFVTAGLMCGMAIGMQFYFNQELAALRKSNDTGAALIDLEKTIKKQVDANRKKMQQVESKIRMLERAMAGGEMFEEAQRLHRVAKQLRKDMVLERVEKNAKGMVTLSGRCYYERSLVAYLKAISPQKGREARLKTLQDARAAQYTGNSSRAIGENETTRTVYLNNRFTVELR